VSVVVRLLLASALLGGCGVGDPDAGPQDPPAADMVDAGPSPSLPDTGPRDAGLPWPDVAPLPDEDTPYDVEIGITDPDTGADYLPLSPGGDIPIGGVGQAGLTARLAVRVNLPAEEAALPEATIDLVVTNVESGVTGENRTFGAPMALRCDDDGACDAAPVLVEITHLAKLPELEGLRVQVDVVVRGADGGEPVLARDRRRGVLQQL
jgi:hypothetical protein